MRILAIDDERSALNVLVRAIKEALPDSEPVSFTLPEEALKYASENNCDIAFVDIEMGEINGIMTARELKK